MTASHLACFVVCKEKEASGVLLAGYITTEGLCLDPIHEYEDAVAGCDMLDGWIASDKTEEEKLTAKAHAEVGTTPEEVGKSSTTGKVSG